MTSLLTFENFSDLMVLIFLQAVLGFDNLLYISIESQRAPVARQHSVRYWGIIIAVISRIILLGVMVALIGNLRDPFYVFEWEGFITGGVNFSTVIFLLGGAFIIYTAVREISHMLSHEHIEPSQKAGRKSSSVRVVMMIVMMNLIFSFDSVLSAIAITDVFAVLAIAILASGVAMLLLAETVTEFLKKNRMYEVLGLFILLIVGVVLLGEAGPAAAHAMHDDSLQIVVFNHPLLPMSKTTFYFSVVVLVLVEIIQSGYQRKLGRKRGPVNHR